ncbi:MAG: hypothetical protein ACC707_18495 [Thiohalomonadales bacterium]
MIQSGRVGTAHHQLSPNSPFIGQYLAASIGYHREEIDASRGIGSTVSRHWLLCVFRAIHLALLVGGAHPTWLFFETDSNRDRKRFP